MEIINSKALIKKVNLQRFNIEYNYKYRINRLLYN